MGKERVKRLNYSRPKLSIIFPILKLKSEPELQKALCEGLSGS